MSRDNARRQPPRLERLDDGSFEPSYPLAVYRVGPRLRAELVGLLERFERGTVDQRTGFLRDLDRRLILVGAFHDTQRTEPASRADRETLGRLARSLEAVKDQLAALSVDTAGDLRASFADSIPHRLAEALGRESLDAEEREEFAILWTALPASICIQGGGDARRLGFALNALGDAVESGRRRLGELPRGRGTGPADKARSEFAPAVAHCVVAAYRAAFGREPERTRDGCASLIFEAVYRDVSGGDSAKGYERIAAAMDESSREP